MQLKGKEAKVFFRTIEANTHRVHDGDDGIVLVVWAKTDVPSVMLTYAKFVEDITGDVKTHLVLSSNHDRFPENAYLHPEIDRVLWQLWIQVRSILGYCVNQWLYRPQIENHFHRPLYVDPSFSGKWAGVFLNTLMTKLEGQHTREIVHVPSLLLFYIWQWFEITKVHIAKGNEETGKLDTFPNYELTEKQKQHILDIILWASEHKDMTLPFVVELSFTWNTTDISKKALNSIDPILEWFFLELQSLEELEQSQRLFIGFSNPGIIEMEKILWLESKFSQYHTPTPQIPDTIPRKMKTFFQRIFPRKS